MDALTHPVPPAPYSFFPRCLQLLAGLLLGLAAFSSTAEELPTDCGDLSNRYGPFDYTNPDHFKNKLPVVEKWHFTKEQELSTYQADSKRRVDLDYTLRAFPNHHRALMALTRTLRLHPNKAWDFRPECYYLRAVAWRPRDPVSRMIYGLYLHQNQRLKEAEQQYTLAVQLLPDYAEAHYNLGLLYADQKRWPEALAEAHRAYALQYPLPGLRNRLLAAAAWQDPPAPAPTAPATAPVGDKPIGEKPINEPPAADQPVGSPTAADHPASDIPVIENTTTNPPAISPPTPVPTAAAVTKQSDGPQ